THARLDPHLRSVLAEWPYLLEDNFEGVRTAFVHYRLEPSAQDFQPVIRNAPAADLDRVFALHDAALIFYGSNATLCRLLILTRPRLTPRRCP
ncbi:MAG: hypothetical protein MUQ30_10030, partial [Anaerolineae bacterium]|nr:hypothetical protein [Anaerolineae bacterium]